MGRRSARVVCLFGECSRITEASSIYLSRCLRLGSDIGWQSWSLFWIMLLRFYPRVGIWRFYLVMFFWHVYSRDVWHIYIYIHESGSVDTRCKLTDLHQILTVKSTDPMTYNMVSQTYNSPFLLFHVWLNKPFYTFSVTIDYSPVYNLSSNFVLCVVFLPLLLHFILFI